MFSASHLCGAIVVDGVAVVAGIFGAAEPVVLVPAGAGPMPVVTPALGGFAGPGFTVRAPFPPFEDAASSMQAVRAPSHLSTHRP